jgi:hypothetical protein
MRVLLALLATLLLLQPSTAPNPNLKHFTTWFSSSANPATAASWMTFMLTEYDPATIRKFHAAGLGPSLFMIRYALFCGQGSEPPPTGPARLCPDYEARWAKLLNTTIRPMLAEGSIMGVNFGDELCWSCLPFSNLSAAVGLVRRDLPRGTAILYYNEVGGCCPWRRLTGNELRRCCCLWRLLRCM